MVAPMNPRTRQNLKTAMKAEAFSFAKCSRFAAHARLTENHQLAELFRTTADVDRCEHFEKESTLANLIGSNLQNLTGAVREKSKQIEMYSLFEAEALSDGDTDVANLFAGIRVDELRQQELLKSSLPGLEKITKPIGATA
jgi:rubrerythrin